MKIIVTGGAGFIGSHTVVELIKNKFTPVIIDDLRNSNAFIIGSISKITGGKIQHYNIDYGNKSKLREIFKNEKPVGVIHFAADKAVNESVLNPLKYYNNNICNLINLLHVISEFKIKCFVFSSSCTVYGLADAIPVKETAVFKPPASPYGHTKQVGEIILNNFFNNLPNSTLIHLRYFNPIGAHPSGLIGELPLGVPTNLIPYITQTASGKRKQLTIHGNNYETKDGTCIRDYIHVVDLARAHVLSLNHSLNNPNNMVLNVGTGCGSSVLEIVNLFQKINELTLNYSFGPRRDGDVPVMYADNNLIRKKINWMPKFTLSDSLKHSWKWEKNLPILNV